MQNFLILPNIPLFCRWPLSHLKKGKESRRGAGEGVQNRILPDISGVRARIGLAGESVEVLEQLSDHQHMGLARE